MTPSFLVFMKTYTCGQWISKGRVKHRQIILSNRMLQENLNKQPLFFGLFVTCIVFGQGTTLN